MIRFLPMIRSGSMIGAGREIHARRARNLAACPA
jgi:hypothetical protein